MGHPTVYPTGVTVYDPGKAWNGYTIFPAADLGALLIDMNGSEVQLWRGLRGFPNKLLPNGQVFGSTELRDPEHGFQDQTDMVQVDWEGNIVWRISHLVHIADPDRSRAGMRASITTFSAKAILSDITCPVRRRPTTVARRYCSCTKTCAIQEFPISRCSTTDLSR
jgi:hypothetical protein